MQHNLAKPAPEVITITTSASRRITSSQLRRFSFQNLVGKDLDAPLAEIVILLAEKELHVSHPQVFKLRREREQASRKEQRSASGNNLPVLADVYTAHQMANEELYRKIHGCMPIGDSALGTSDMDAYARGRAAGGGISLATQVSGKGTRALPRR